MICQCGCMLRREETGHLKMLLQDSPLLQVYDEEGVDRTPKQLVQRQMVSVQPPPQAALPSMLPGGHRPPGASILGRHHRESRMGSRMSKLSKSSALSSTENGAHVTCLLLDTCCGLNFEPVQPSWLHGQCRCMMQMSRWHPHRSSGATRGAVWTSLPMT